MRKKVEKNIAYDDVKKLYYVTFYYGVIDGKKKQETKTFTNKKDAKKSLTEFEYQKTNGLLAKPDGTTMGELFDRFIKSKETAECAVTTIGGYKRIWGHMSPIFKDVKVQDLTPLMVDNYFNIKREESKNKLKENPNAKVLNTNSLRKHYNLINQMVSYAVKKDIIKVNFMEKVDKPAYIKPDYEVYEKEEMQKLLPLLTDYYFDVAIKIAIYLGVRLSEVMGLKWDNVDFEKRLIYIKEANVVDSGKVYTKCVKTESSERKLYIPDALMEDLKKSKEKYNRRKSNPHIVFEDSGYVIFNDDGSAAHPGSVSKYFKKFLEKNSMKHIRFHDLRHSFASIAIAEKLPIYDISKALGHSSTATTEKIYVKQIRDTNKEAINTIASVIKI